MFFERVSCLHSCYDLQRKVTFNSLVQKRTFQRSHTEILHQFGHTQQIIEDPGIVFPRSLLFDNYVSDRNISEATEYSTSNKFLNSVIRSDAYYQYCSDIAMQLRPSEESTVVSLHQITYTEKNFTELTAIVLTDISDILAARMLRTVDKAQGIASDLLGWSNTVAHHSTSSSGFSSWAVALLRQSAKTILPTPSKLVDLFQHLEEKANPSSESKITSIIGLASSLISIPTILGKLLINKLSKFKTSDSFNTSSATQFETSATLSTSIKLDNKKSFTPIDICSTPSDTKFNEKKYCAIKLNNTIQAKFNDSHNLLESAIEGIPSIDTTFINSDEESNEYFCDSENASDIESDSTIE
ncbi:hypothetical protein HK096_002926, partial [Nowakowskiella sp. JEL0078]